MSLRTASHQLMFLVFALSSTMEARGQNRFFPEPDPQRKAAREARRMQARAAYLADPWGRMPIWSAGAFISSGYDAQHALEADLMRRGSRDKGASWGFEATKRLNKGWFVTAAIDHSTQQHVGADSLHLVSWDDSWWTTDYHYQADLIAIQSSINSLTLGTGIYAIGFPRRHAIGCTVSGYAGLSVHFATNSYGAVDDKEFTVTEGGLDLGYDEGDPMPPALLEQWNKIGRFDRRTSVGFSGVLAIRPEIWITQHVSIPMDLRITIPVIKPSFAGSYDPSGLFRVPDHKLDLTGYALTAGLSVHL